LHDSASVLIFGALLAAALAASLIAGRLRLPGLVLFLGLGMLIGSDGLGWIDFNDFELAESVGVTALALILFEGGLAAGFDELRPVLRPAVGLAVAGTLVTALVTGVAAAWLFDFPLVEGLLLGSIIASTDGAAVFSLLRGAGLRRRLERTLEGEAGFNDPIAVLLVLGFIEWVKHDDYGLPDMLLLLATFVLPGGMEGRALTSEEVPEQRLARLGVEPERQRSAVHPVNLDPVRRLALHHQQAIVQCGVMTRAQQRHIP